MKYSFWSLFCSVSLVYNFSTNYNVICLKLFKKSLIFYIIAYIDRWDINSWNIKALIEKKLSPSNKRVSFSLHALEQVIEIPAANKGSRRELRQISEKLSSDLEMYRYQRRLCCRKWRDPSMISYGSHRPLDITKNWKQMQSKLVKMFQNEWATDLSMCFNRKQIDLLQPMIERAQPNAELFSIWNYWTLLIWSEEAKQNRIQELRRTLSSSYDSDDSDTSEEKDEKPYSMKKASQRNSNFMELTSETEKQLLQLLERLMKCKEQIFAAKKNVVHNPGI
ncbi:hypothetical protein RFI_29963 [Reticulomyxa filosa]|uniref:Uncharacterized protein n=1 Tax=Reticulomyxa filosa TaxID=46433 RepID=X6M336_RETFI|nr:hypothetical protein RFI_29963 [Reticulomyxa filosa]|eukprot:ETO07430.1 hypothetical protein RFI_29963 [Reticulomyxa filosa]